MFSGSFIALDTETTGFPSHPWSRVIELGAVVIDCEGNIADEFSRLIRPDVIDSRADGALAINHITREEVDAADDTATVIADFASWADGRYVTAYNVDFDRPMMERASFRGRWASCIMLRSMAIMGPAGVLRPASPSQPRYRADRPWLWPSLAAAGDYFGVPPCEPAHRALSDAKRAAGVAVAMQRLAVST